LIKKDAMFAKLERYEWVWLAALLLTPFVLWLLPADIFDEGKIILCPSRLFFDIECFGCGMTRAIMHMHHFEFADALYFNQASVIVYPGLIVTWFIWVSNSYKRYKALKTSV
jgi:hypothetical protein